eukprot:SAG11_NODE_4223_length_2002_cov_3.231618_2_plen_53_part_01
MVIWEPGPVGCMPALNVTRSCRTIELNLMRTAPGAAAPGAAAPGPAAPGPAAP